MNWKKYWRTLVTTTLGIFIFVCSVIYIVNPYGDIPFAPPFEKAVMATNQRFSYPSVARDPDFDSAVFGTSTSRLLQPEKLNAAFGGSFANLAMNSATAYEQYRLFQVFLRKHPRPRTVIIGVDNVWCHVSDTLIKYTFRPFPEWMYDDNAWNDIPELLSFKTLEITGRKIGYLIGVRDSKYDINGYRDFLPPASEYDLDRAREHIYGSVKQKKHEIPENPVQISDKELAAWEYPSHDLLKDILVSLAPETRKVLFFVPYHAYFQAVPGTRNWYVQQECKSRISSIVASFQNVTLADFMIPSALTTVDQNYWDPLHYSSEMSVKLVSDLKLASEHKVSVDQDYRLLVPDFD